MSARLPMPWTLGSFEGSPEDTEGPASVRAQTAVVRTLADTLEQLAPSSDAAVAIRQQLAEELARLGYRIQEAAALRGLPE
jgi:hypothetical protein